jgi:3-hydroxymyristoyl/3-hydroxydecanoyl-(acyl carrier protein) dehydratase
MVKPGDEITIEVTMKETISRFFFMSAKVLKDGKPCHDDWLRTRDGRRRRKVK